MKEIVITSSVLILALLVLRFVFAKKVSRRLIYAAWLLVALRLVIPAQVGNLDFSVLTAAQPLTETISEFTDLRVAGQTETDAQKQVIAQYIEDDLSVFEDAVHNRIEEAQRNYYTTEEIAQMVDKIYSVDTAFKPDAQDQVTREIEARTNPVSLGNVLTVIWLVGVAAMGGWFLFVNLRYGKNLRRDAQRLDCDSPIPVYVSEFADSPCLAGLLRPTIYMNPYCAESEEMRRHVLTHELTHYRHKDHLWNLVRCLCLCVYWFHPLVWVAVYVCRRDCELACDEGAMEKLGDDERISYGKTLLEVVRHRLYPSDWLQSATSMTETKRELENRLNFIAKKSRISFIAAVAMVLVCAIVTGCVAAGPGGEANEPERKKTVYLPASYKLVSEEETRETHYTYDDYGRLIAATMVSDSEDAGHVEDEYSFSYNEHGHLTREYRHYKRSYRGRDTEGGWEATYLYSYDDQGRVLFYAQNPYVHYDGSQSGSLQEYNFEYDDEDRTVTVTGRTVSSDGDVSDDWYLCYLYDKKGRMEQEIRCSVLPENFENDWQYKFDKIEYSWDVNGRFTGSDSYLGYAMEKLAPSEVNQVETWKDAYKLTFYRDDQGNFTGFPSDGQFKYDKFGNLILEDRIEMVSVRGEKVERVYAKYTRDEKGNITKFENYLKTEEVTYVTRELTESQNLNAQVYLYRLTQYGSMLQLSEDVRPYAGVYTNIRGWFNDLYALLPSMPWEFLFEL